MNEQPDRKRQGDVFHTHSNEEILIPDVRAQLTPAQMVERKLASMLKRCPLMVSQLRTAARIRLP
jgi:hypothetical protein